MYAVIKENAVVSYLISQEQIAFLAEQDPALRFVDTGAEWDSENPPSLSDCQVLPDGSVLFRGAVVG